MKNKFKKIALLLTAPLAMAVFSASIKCPEVDSDHTILLPNPDDCSSFYMCVDGVPIFIRCLESLFFDPTLDVCRWPQEIAPSILEYCGERIPGGNEPDCPKIKESSTGIITVTVCNRRTSFAAGLVGISCDEVASTACSFTNL